MRFLFRACVPSMAFLCLALSAPRAEETEVTRAMLASSSPGEMRDTVLARARRTQPGRRAEAGEAFFWAARLFERAGLQDSAVATYRQAVALRGDDAERLSLADALLARRGDGDVVEALATLNAGLANATAQSTGSTLGYESRIAWAQHLAGRSDSAQAAFQRLEHQIGRQFEWRYRMAVTEMAAGDPKRAWTWLFPLAVVSRKQDDDVMARLNEVASQFGAASRMHPEIDRAIHKRDQLESAVLEAMHARRVRFPADDGFPLAAALITPASKTKRWGAVVLVAPGDTIADYDSLVVALTKAGCAVALLDVRGSGWSIAPSCPLPDRWAGREDELSSACAGDVRRALRALAANTPLDTTRYAVVGVNATAAIAAEAAERDPRVAALLLVSPRPTLPERGPMRARLARLALPVYFQSGPEDFPYASFTEALYEAGNRGASRVVEARLVGHGARQFYYDPAMSDRFSRWLGETLRQAKRRAPRPAPPPRG